MKKAIIFDMDGVLIDSEVAWHELEYQHYRQLIPGWTRADHKHLTGMSQKDSYPMLKERYGLEKSWEDYLAFYDKTAEEVYHNRCELIPGSLDFMEELRLETIPMGLASSSPHHWIRMVFQRFPLLEFFACVVSSEDVGRKGKPAPDVYLEAVKRLGMKPEDCVAIEDSSNGVLSARRAGLFTVGFRTEHNKELDFPEADMVVEGFSRENREMMMGLLR